MAKHVPSAVPGHGPVDMSGDLAAHREREPGPTTVGVNPDPPDTVQTSGDEDTATAGPEVVAYPLNAQTGAGWY